MKISIVIPTYNRSEQLSEVIDCLLKSEIEGFSEVEIIVIDDGSSVPAKDAVTTKKVNYPFKLRYFYQDNAGPAEARNHGFREARNEIVLFIDDDILVFPDLIKKHAEAHQIHEGSIIFGQSPYFPPKESTSSYRYLNKLVDDGLDLIKKDQIEQFVRVEIVASGNLSVDKKIFPEGTVYEKNLNVPASEEFELSYSLMQRNVPVYFAPEIKGWHLQPTGIEDCCKQNYKYGLGIAELAQKCPNVLELKQLANIYRANRQIDREDPVRVKIKKGIRRILSTRIIRERILGLTKIFEAMIPNDKFLFMIYRLSLGNYFVAGMKDGEKMFGEGKS